MMDWANTSALYEDATASTGNWTTELTVAVAPQVADWLVTFRYTTQVGIALPISVLGIIGNLLSFIVLCRYKQKSTTRVLLQGLAVTDGFNLLLAVLLRLLRPVIPGYKRSHFFIYMFLYFYPAVYILRLAGTWMTALLTVDRFIAVRFPLHAQRLCTLRRTYSLMALTVLLSSLVCIPKFFEYRLVRWPSASGYVGILPTPFQANQVYTLWYRIVLYLFIMYLLPTILLIVLNSLLLRTLRRASSSRKAMQQKYIFSNEVLRPSTYLKVHNGGRHTPASQPPNNNHSVTIIVVAVVLVSIVCNVTALVAHVLWSLSTSFDNMDHLEDAKRVMSNINNVFVVINSASNFVIYCFCSRNFRDVFKRTFNEAGQCTRAWKLIERKRNGQPESRGSSTSYVSLQRLSNNLIQKKNSSLANSTKIDEAPKVLNPQEHPPSGLTPLELVLL